MSVIVPFEDPAPLKPAQASREGEYQQHHAFRGRPLHKFSIVRKRLLLDIRAAAGSPLIGTMEAMLGDALRWLWLCSQDAQALESAQCGIGLAGSRESPLPLRMQLACDRWAEAQEITPAEQNAAVNDFLDDWLATERTVAVDAGASDEELPGE